MKINLPLEKLFDQDERIRIKKAWIRVRKQQLAEQRLHNLDNFHQKENYERKLWKAPKSKGKGIVWYIKDFIHSITP